MAGAATASPSESADLRGPIAASWERSQEAGVDPFVERVAPAVADADEVAARWEVHPLFAAAPLIREYVEAVGDAQGIIVVTDAQGTVLWIDGDPDVRFDAAAMCNLKEGASWSEADAGTNAIGTGLAAQHALQVFASEHFNEVVHAWTCSAAPVRDPDRGELLGIVDLTGRSSNAHPYSFASAVATAGAVEAHLRSAMLERDARLRSRYEEKIRRDGRRVLVSTTGRILSSHPDGWLSTERLSVPPEGGELVLPSGARAFAEPVGHAEAYIVNDDQASRARPRPLLKLRLLGEGPPLAELGGRAVRLSPRHAEVLALLSSRRGGMTSEELAADLYGDRGQPGAARVEMSRLRKRLGGGIDADAYRLTIDTESDLAHVRTLLDRGEIRVAVEHYAGPLLPRSEAPGIARERDELEAWVRQGVMSADDGDALWAWVQCSSGRDDLPAWKRLLTHLDFRDPRRSLAAARVRSLRVAFATP
jgi:GAF domain-containing protein